MTASLSPAACLAESVDACARCDRGVVVAAARDRAEAHICEHLHGCPSCRGRGFRLQRDAAGYEVMQPCDLRHIRRRIAIFNEARLPAAFHAATLREFRPRANSNQGEIEGRFSKLSMWLQQTGTSTDGHVLPGHRGIGLQGGPGLGKTHLLAAMARHFTLDLGVPARFIDFAHLLWELKAGFAGGMSEAQVIAPLAEVEVLFIDELGKGRASEWELTVLDAMVCARYNRSLMTFFATNFPFTQPDLRNANDAYRLLAGDRAEVKTETLLDRTNERIYSRLQAMCEFVTVTGIDARTEITARAAGRGTGPIDPHGLAPTFRQRRPGEVPK
jgi:DNA replication protein DnaC